MFLFDTTAGLGFDGLMTIDVLMQSFMYILRSMRSSPCTNELFALHACIVSYHIQRNRLIREIRY